ncbi:MAG: hypothetical protein MK102_15665 [Fuerstiella sp.]|nr:hypothetical protein [Fuerstiella sp.]
MTQSQANDVRGTAWLGSQTHPSGKVVVATMHLSKGLEFRAVVVMACDDEVISLHKKNRVRERRF